MSSLEQSHSSLGASASVRLGISSLTLNLLNAPYKLAENYWTYVADIADRDRYRELIEDIRQAQTSDYIAYNLSASHNDPQSFFTPDFGLLVKSLASRKQMELQGLMDEMVTATRLYWKICDFVPLKEEEKEVIANMSEPCKQYLNATNDNITSIKENNKKTHGFRVNETGEIQNEDLSRQMLRLPLPKAMSLPPRAPRVP